MANEDLIAPRFYTAAVEDPIETKKQGRPIFRDDEFVEVKFAGDRQRIHVAPAHEAFRRDKVTNEWITYAQEYAPLYKRFKEGLTEETRGTPLSELPFLTEAKRSELKALNIKSAEALASLDGAPLKMLGMGGRDLKNQAQAYLDKANGSADAVRLTAENDALRRRLDDMQAQMQDLISAQKSPAKPSKAKKDAPREPSVFIGFDDDDIRNWLTDSGFSHEPAWGRDQLLAAADKANAELAERKAA